jgi:hypothetical protein
MLGKKLKLSAELVDKNVVIIANVFNLSIMNQHWLIEKGILREEDLAQGYTFTPIFAQAQSKDFYLTIVPDRLQFKMLQIKNPLPLILSKVGKIVEELPQTPFAAVGFNYTYQAIPVDSDISKLTRKLFFNSDSALCNYFKEEDARFGGYFSKDVLNSRLRLNIQPVCTRTPDEHGANVEKLQFAFNFNFDLSGQTGRVKLILDFLNKWNDAKKITADILDLIK